MSLLETYVLLFGGAMVIIMALLFIEVRRLRKVLERK
jgi:hypothetical protein